MPENLSVRKFKRKRGLGARSQIFLGMKVIHRKYF